MKAGKSNRDVQNKTRNKSEQVATVQPSQRNHNKITTKYSFLGQ